MLSNDKNMEQLEELLKETAEMLKLQKKFLQLDVAEKSSILISTFVMLVVCVILGAFALLFLSFAAAHFINETFNCSMAQSYGYVAAFNIALGVYLYIRRKTLIMTPITKFIVKCLLK